MASQLLSRSVAAPGFKGLNTQLQGSYLDIGWASEANNCIVDRFGRLSARKGWVEQGTITTGTIKQIYEYIDASGTLRIISAGNNKLYSGVSTPTDVTGTLTPTADNWKFQNFNGRVVGWQAGHTPIQYNGANFSNITVSSGGGTLPLGNEVLAAWGRLWAFDSTHTIVRYSDLLLRRVWDDSSSPGSAGLIDLKSVWSNGMDVGVALASFNGHLIIFGRNNILVYQGADNPGTDLALVEDIRGIGCLARDSVQHAGTDIVWLSPNGIESFGRVIQEQSMPYTNLSKNVRDSLLASVGDVDPDDIRSVYYPKEGLYILSLFGTDKVYVFDMKVRLEDNTVRVTTWTDNVPSAMWVTTDQTLYLGHGSSIATYGGFDDNDTAYRVKYYTGWVSLADDTTQMILKKLGGIIFSEGGVTVSFKWSFDFSESFSNYNYEVNSGDPAEYNIDEFGIGEYTGGIRLSTVNFSADRTGSALMVGLETDVLNSFTIQRLDIKVKQGRVL